MARKENLIPGLPIYRKLAGMTQKELGEKVGVTKMTISRWEVGVYEPTITTLSVMADILGCEVGDFLNPPNPLVRKSDRGKPEPTTEPAA